LKPFRRSIAHRQPYLLPGPHGDLRLFRDRHQVAGVHDFRQAARGLALHFLAVDHCPGRQLERRGACGRRGGARLGEQGEGVFSSPAGMLVAGALKPGGRFSRSKSIGPIEAVEPLGRDADRQGAALPDGGAVGLKLTL